MVRGPVSYVVYGSQLFVKDANGKLYTVGRIRGNRPYLGGLAVIEPGDKRYPIVSRGNPNLPHRTLPRFPA